MSFHYTFAKYTKLFCEYLLRHDEPRFIEENEVRFITKDTEDAQKLLKNANIFKEDALLDQRIVIMSSRRITSQVPIDEFKKALKSSKENDTSTDTSVPDPELSRLMECIAVKKEDIHLLCDDPRSLMRIMYNSTMVMLHSYEFPQDT